MICEPINDDERLNLLATRGDALRRYNQEMDRIAVCKPADDAERSAVAAAEEHMTAATRAERAYFERLPRVVMSYCPFDGKPLVRTFDPYGFDGPWWRSDATPDEPPSCPHFCLLRGAVVWTAGASDGEFIPKGVSLRERTPVEVFSGAYVIPRILELPDMIAVITQLEMSNGTIVYPIAYFAPRRPPVQQLAANWPRSVFLYTTALGEHLWRHDDEERDYDLAPWIARDKVRILEPGLIQ